MASSGRFAVPAAAALRDGTGGVTFRVYKAVRTYDTATAILVATVRTGYKLIPVYIYCTYGIRLG